jgi:hypothetical protein
MVPSISSTTWRIAENALVFKVHLAIDFILIEIVHSAKCRRFTSKLLLEAIFKSTFAHIQSFVAMASVPWKSTFILRQERLSHE